MIKNPFPNHVIAIIDKSVIDGTEFAGDDKFDLPQSGTLIKVSDDDKDRAFNKAGDTYGSLVGKRIFWAKYAEADAMYFDSDTGKDLVIINIDKLRGYDN